MTRQDGRQPARPAMALRSACAICAILLSNHAAAPALDGTKVEPSFGLYQARRRRSAQKRNCMTDAARRGAAIAPSARTASPGVRGR